MSSTLSSEDLSFLKNSFLDVLIENSSQPCGEIYRSAVLLGIELDIEKHFIFPDGKRYKLELVEVKQEKNEKKENKEKKNVPEPPADFNTCFSNILRYVHPDMKLANDACLWLENFSRKAIPFLISNIDMEHNTTIMKNKLWDAIGGELGKHAAIELEKSLTNQGSLSISPSLISRVMKNETTLDKYTAAVLDYLLTEILELAGNVEMSSKTITVSSIKNVIDNDAEIKNLLKRLKFEI